MSENPKILVSKKGIIVPLKASEKGGFSRVLPCRGQRCTYWSCLEQETSAFEKGKGKYSTGLYMHTALWVSPSWWPQNIMWKNNYRVWQLYCTYKKHMYRVSRKKYIQRKKNVALVLTFTAVCKWGKALRLMMLNSPRKVLIRIKAWLLY